MVRDHKSEGLPGAGLSGLCLVIAYQNLVITSSLGRSFGSVNKLAWVAQLSKVFIYPLHFSIHERAHEVRKGPEGYT